MVCNFTCFIVICPSVAGFGPLHNRCQSFLASIESTERPPSQTFIFVQRRAAPRVRAIPASKKMSPVRHRAEWQSPTTAPGCRLICHIELDAQAHSRRQQREPNRECEGLQADGSHRERALAQHLHQAECSQPHGSDHGRKPPRTGPAIAAFCRFRQVDLRLGSALMRL